MVKAILQGVLRSAPLKPVRNLLRPLVSRWARPVPVKLACGYVCYVDLRSAIGRGLLVKGDFDPALGQFIDSVLQPGGVFLDVGANVGYFSLRALARVGAAGEVHAFEMEARSLRCLDDTKRKGKLDNLTVHKTAVGDREGTVGVVSAAEIGQSWVNAQGTGVTMRPLDAWLAEFEGKRLQLIKIDVEGMEFKVLQGARQLLTRHRPIVVSEALEMTMDRFQEKPDDLISYMAGLGYWKSDLAGTNDTNWVFTPVERSPG